MSYKSNRMVGQLGQGLQAVGRFLNKRREQKKAQLSSMYGFALENAKDDLDYAQKAGDQSGVRNALMRKRSLQGKYMQSMGMIGKDQQGAMDQLMGPAGQRATHIGSLMEAAKKQQGLKNRYAEAKILATQRRNKMGRLSGVGAQAGGSAAFNTLRKKASEAATNKLNFDPNFLKMDKEQQLMTINKRTNELMQQMKPQAQTQAAPQGNSAQDMITQFNSGITATSQTEKNTLAQLGKLGTGQKPALIQRARSLLNNPQAMKKADVTPEFLKAMIQKLAGQK